MGEMTLAPMTIQSAYGPVGHPAHQAVYPGIGAADGKPMNAQNDYVLRMTKDELPPAQAFWSVTPSIGVDALTGSLLNPKSNNCKTHDP